ncbi:MAG: substrate-binding domain-containing protein, partial [Acidobacteria bacterium]|nr:substrate-binding domain-containing protein [Acidobacteriota bacterium]
MEPPGPGGTPPMNADIWSHFRFRLWRTTARGLGLHVMNLRPLFSSFWKAVSYQRSDESFRREAIGDLNSVCLLEKARTGVSRRGVLALAAAGLLGCRPAGRTKRRIAVVPKSTTHVFWQSIHAGVLAAGQKLGVEILWNGPASDTDYGRQIQIFDAMVAQRVDGIAVSASDRGALNPAL